MKSDRIAHPESLGNIMKDLEGIEAQRRAIPGLTLMARLDGKSFSTFTKSMDRPWDTAMMYAMCDTTMALVKEFKPLVGYTQSDEITLAFADPQNLFNGRFQKFHSVLAGYASANFALIAQNNYNFGIQGWTDKIPCFDCRVWQVPSINVALEALVWREDDAVKNSVAMLAQSVFSHKELFKKGRNEMLDMLMAKGINWNDTPIHFRRGIYIRNRVIQKPLDEVTRLKIPEKHRPAEGTLVDRGETYVLDVPKIRTMTKEEAIKLLLTKS
jgi:tRNA(His) guanylyltransferase